MIIELFGPPGAGKTTFSHALHAQLQRRGQAAKLIVSHRPAEEPDSRTGVPTRHPTAAVVRRLSRPLVEMLKLVGHPFANAGDIGTAAALVRMLPPKNRLWYIKMCQYICRLSHAWHQQSAADHLVLFDQAYVQVVSSLAILSGITDETVWAHALNAVPKADLLILVRAHPGVLENRLNERRARQGPVERLLEFDLKTNLRTIQIIDRLYDLLRRNGQPVVTARSHDQQSLRESSENIAQYLLDKFPPRYTGAA